MRKKVLAIAGIVTRLLQFLTSAQDNAGNYLAPGAAVAATGTAWLAFVVVTVVVLWRRAKAAAVTFGLAELALFSFAALQLAVPFSSGSIVVLLWNATKIVELIAFIWVLLKLFRSGPSPSRSTGEVHPVPKELGGVRLGTSAAELDTSDAWRELTGPEKTQFDSGIPGERLFSGHNGDWLVLCGVVYDRLYKVGLMADASEKRRLLSEYTGSLGRPKVTAPGWYTWENGERVLQMHVRGTQLNVMLTDKGVLARNPGDSAGTVSDS